VIVPVRFEASITSLENTENMSKITLAELVSFMKAQEPMSKCRRSITSQIINQPRKKEEEFQRKRNCC